MLASERVQSAYCASNGSSCILATHTHSMEFHEFSIARMCRLSDSSFRLTTAKCSILYKTYEKIYQLVTYIFLDFNKLGINSHSHIKFPPGLRFLSSRCFLPV